MVAPHREWGTSTGRLFERAFEGRAVEDEFITGTGRHFGHLLRPVTPTPRRWTMIAPRAAIAEAECFDGAIRVLDIDVVATALRDRMLLIQQPDDGSGWGAPWFAWLPVERVQLKP